MEAETAKTRIQCPVCKAVVPLLTRRQGDSGGGRMEPVTVYITQDGQHLIENAHVFGRRYPDVFVASCHTVAGRL